VLPTCQSLNHWGCQRPGACRRDVRSAASAFAVPCTLQQDRCTTYRMRGVNIMLSAYQILLRADTCRKRVARRLSQSCHRGDSVVCHLIV